MGTSCTTAQSNPDVPLRDICERNLTGKAYLVKNEQKIRLEGNLKTMLPEGLQSKMANYTISYRIKYGKQQFIWAEESKSLEYIAEKPFVIDYALSAENQTINVVLEFKPIKGLNNSKAVKQNNKTHTEFLTDSEANLIIINIQAYFDVHSLLMEKGDYGHPLHLNAKELTAAISAEETKDDPLFQQYPPVSISLTEIKPENLKKIRFRARGKFNKKNRVFLTIYEMVGAHRKYIYETLPVA